MTTHLDLTTINALLTPRLAALARELTGAEPTSSSASELRFRARGSLAVCVGGAKRGAWHDHEAGCGGDPLGLIAHLRHVPMRDAFAWALSWLADATSHRCTRPLHRPVATSGAHRVAVAENECKRWSADMARTLWSMAESPVGTLVHRYLASRGLELPQDAPVRFHPAAWRNRHFGPRGPAMLALMTSPRRPEPIGLHITYLLADGSGKAAGERPKVMLGTAGVVRLVPDDDVTLGLGIAEGIETALAVMQRAGCRPVWAATSAGAIKRLPMLAGIETMTVFADADGPGMAAARECCRRWAEAGREGRILAPPVGDWDDALPRIAGDE